MLNLLRAHSHPLAFMILGTLTFAMAGCMTHRVASEQRLTNAPGKYEPNETIWPTRYTAMNRQIADAMNRSAVIKIKPNDALTTILLGETHDALEHDHALEYSNAVPAGQGVIRMTTWTPSDIVNGTRMEFHEWLGEADAQASLQIWQDFADGKIEAIDTDEILVPSLYLLDPPPDKPSLGLAIFLNGYGATRHFIGGAEALRERGWHVLIVPSISLGIALANMPTPVVERYDFEDGPAWFATEFENKNRSTYRQIQLDEIGALVARAHDDRLAVTAYAVEAALAYLAEYRPDVPQHPRILLAISLGALMAPPMVARIGGVDAAVIVTGGANLFGLIKESQYELATLLMGNITRIEYPDSVENDYLIESHLDPWRTSQVLRETPLLVIQSSNDDAVPSEYGELLWELLGRPDRLESNLNHVGVLASLGWHIDWIVDWIETQVPLSSRSPKQSTDSNFQ